MKLISICDIRPSTYNPRTTDPARLDMIELSLRKLGFLLPIYADADGEILSGHQRLIVARRIGLSKVPVEYTREMELAQRKAVNIAFNRATNDLASADTTASLTSELRSARVQEVAERLPDKQPNSPEFYPCLKSARVAIKPLLRVNSARWVKYASVISRMLLHKGILMPIITRPSGLVVNGIGRLEMLAEMKKATAEIVKISDAEADLAEAMLNLLSMDFSIHERYDDLLRYNSFRRARRARSYLGRGFVFATVGAKPAKQFDILNPSHRRRWTAIHGEKILDFGAGHLTETRLLQQAGLDVTPFEPYRLGPDSQIDKAESIHLSRQFLKAVATGKKFSSIFISSVLNSVPFEHDRRQIVTICSALCDGSCRLYACASSDNQTGWKSLNGKEYINATHQNNLTFRLDYEDNIQLGDISQTPKVQKYHSRRQFRELFETVFESVEISEQSNNVQAICRRPRAIDPASLRAALEFEFDLPYPDGSRMGLVNQAIDAFLKRKRLIRVKL